MKAAGLLWLVSLAACSPGEDAAARKLRHRLTDEILATSAWTLAGVHFPADGGSAIFEFHGKPGQAHFVRVRPPEDRHSGQPAPEIRVEEALGGEGFALKRLSDLEAQIAVLAEKAQLAKEKTSVSPPTRELLNWLVECLRDRSLPWRAPP